MNNELIYRQQAIEAVCEEVMGVFSVSLSVGYDVAEAALEKLPLAQSEQTKMIKEIREWINSENRGSADYFIVDKIEEIIDKYE